MKCTSEVSIAPRYRTVGDLVGFVTGKKKYYIHYYYYLKFENNSQISVSVFENSLSSESLWRNEALSTKMPLGGL